MPRPYRTSLLAPLLLLACASSPTSTSTVAPQPGPAPVSVDAAPPVEPSLSAANQPTVVVASARLVSDCEEPESNAPTCLWSSLNLTVHNNAAEPQQVKIRSVKLVRPEHEAVLAELAAVNPQHWVEDRYAEWDANAAPGHEEKILYVLSTPSWTDVEAKMGGSTSFGPPFRLMIEVSVGESLMTVFSPTVFREYEDMVVT